METKMTDINKTTAADLDLLHDSIGRGVRPMRPMRPMR
jgi:hypothetical protein